eukprot:4570384-Amphidinium_carterae.1
MTSVSMGSHKEQWEKLERYRAREFLAFYHLMISSIVQIAIVWPGCYVQHKQAINLKMICEDLKEPKENSQLTTTSVLPRKTT